MYYIVYFFWYVLSLIPLRIHYVFSDFLFIIIYYMAWGNLKTGKNQKMPKLYYAEKRMFWDEIGYDKTKEENILKRG